MYHAAMHDARDNTLIVVIQSQRYALHSAVQFSSVIFTRDTIR